MIFWTVFVVLCQWQSVLSQTTPIDVQKCEEYKKRVYERVESYGFFFHGAPTVNVTIDDCKRFDGLITNGEVANPKEFPVMARLGNFDEEAGDTEIKWFCGGTLISEKWVLTAAHCFRALQGEVNRVRLGELVFDSDKDDAQPEDFEVRQVIEHPDFDKDNDDSAYNDIGLVELSRNVDFSLYKHPACLPSTSGDEKSQFVAAGWGSTRFQDASSKQLMKVTLDYFSADRCHEIVKASPTFTRGLVRSQQLCAGGRRGDTCQGDSGGPLLAFHTYPCMYTLVGITSKGFVCGTPDIPGIYTRVYPYLSWIRSIVWP